MDSGPSDEALLKAFFKGDDDSLGELARRYEDALLGLACGLLHARRDLARDAVQDAWIRVIRYGRGFKSNSSVRTWLYRITINRCRDLLKKEARLREKHSREPSAGHVVSPERSEGTEERNHAVQTAVDQLSLQKREVILLCYHRAMTHEQAAEILEIPLGTLKSRLHGALSDLRERLSQEVIA